MFSNVHAAYTKSFCGLQRPVGHARLSNLYVKNVHVGIAFVLAWNHLSYFSLWLCYQRRCAATLSGNRVNHMQVSTQHSSAPCVLLFHYCLKHSWVNQPGQCTDMIVKGCVRRAPKKMHVVLQQRRHLRNWVADVITTSWCLLGSFWDSSLLHLGEPTTSLL